MCAGQHSTQTLRGPPAQISGASLCAALPHPALGGTTEESDGAGVICPVGVTEMIRRPMVTYKLTPLTTGMNEEPEMI